MIKKKEIKELSGSTAYQRGKNIYEANKVLEFDVDNQCEYEYISAVVKGSGAKKYHVQATYNLEEDVLEEIECECPAYTGYYGICKHCVAALLEYIEYTKTVDVYGYREFEKKLYEQNLIKNVVNELGNIEDEAALRNAIEDFLNMANNSINMANNSIQLYESNNELRNQEKAKKKPEAKIVVEPTTFELKQLMDQKQLQKRKILLEDNVLGKVKLEPILSVYEYGETSLGFKVGINQMYVIKDLREFCANIVKNINYSYGQKLQFVHSMEAFREEDKPLVEFIFQWVRRSESFGRMNWYYQDYIAKKNMALSTDDLETFINIMGERAFLVKINDCKESLFQVTKEKLPREIFIKEKGEGVEIQLNSFLGFKCTTQSIYFYDHKIYLCPVEELHSLYEFMRCMANQPEGKAYIAKADVPSFCRQFLPAIEKHYICHKENFDEKKYGIIPAEFKIYLDMPQKEWVTCKAEAIYGDKIYNVFEAAEDIGRRELDKELEVEKLIMTYATSYNSEEKLAVIFNEDQIYEFLSNGIEKLNQVATVYISDKLKRLQIKPSPKVTVGVAVEGNTLELSMLSDDLSNEELVDLLNKYKQKKRYYRLKNGDFVHISEEDMETLGELKQSLGLSDKQLKEGKVTIPKYRALYVDHELKANKSLKTSKNKAFRELVRNMKTVEDNDFEIPEFLESTLREYQKRGYLWLKTLKHNGFGGVLADDMGLGKTLQVITFLASEYLENTQDNPLRTLIVCPASLVYNWKAEIEKFAPDLKVRLAVGSITEREAVLGTLENRDIVVTSYDLLKRDLKYYKDIKFAYEVIDEGQYIKNHITQAAKAVKEVQADFKIALTGTPIENRLSELWSLFDYIMPGFLYAYPSFKQELEQPIVQGKDELAIKRLQKMIQPFVLRRLKREVLTDLPDKIEENRYISLTGEQQKLYDANVKKLKLLLDKQTEESFKQSKIQILAELTKLRQICCDPSLLYEDYKGESAKVDMCIELIQNAIQGGHKILVFSQFTTMLERLCTCFEKEKISYYMLTGATSKEKRMEMVERFNKDETSVFCISLKAGGTGLNLTAADIVIHYDPWWNVAVQNQATDRAHRIGQENVVNVYKLIAKGTIEDNIIKIQDLKKELAEQILNGEGMNTGSFTKEELLELLQ